MVVGVVYPIQFVSLDGLNISSDEWHHLVWIKNEGQHTLYFNGLSYGFQIQSNPLSDALGNVLEIANPAKNKYDCCQTASIYVAHVHGYDRALEATEVVADKMSQYNAITSFTDQYPLNFTLKDRSIEGAPEMSDDKLIIEDYYSKRTHLL